MRGFIPPVNVEETVFCKKAIDICQKSQDFDMKGFSLFLDLRQRDLFVSQYNKFKYLNVKYCFGFTGDGQRCIVAVYPVNQDLYDYEIPITVLCSKLNVEHNLTHRDFLGSLMSLKINRDFIGDILVFEDKVYIVVHNNFVDIIIEELKNVRKSNTNFYICDDEINFQEKFSSISGTTLPSMRIDSVIANSLKVSRSNAISYLKQGIVSVNHMQIKDADFKIEDRDIISIRGFGKYKIFTNGNRSKKDRIFIEIKKYG